jgi:hypothetical protein
MERIANIELMEDIVYVSVMNAYVDASNNEAFSATAFNQRYGQYVPPVGSIKPAATTNMPPIED